MRPFFAVLLSVGLIGSTFAYVRFTERVQPPELVIQEDFVEDSDIFVVIERTFDCFPNSDFGQPAMLVSFRGEEVFRAEEQLTSKQLVRLGPLEDVVVGDNGLVIQINTAVSAETIEQETDEWIDDAGGEGGSIEYSDAFDDETAGANSGQPAIPRAMRIRVSRGPVELMDRSIWLNASESEIAEEVSFRVPAE